MCVCAGGRGVPPASPVRASARYKLCQLLPRLRASLRLPADKQLLQQLNFCVQKLLCREKDKDVVATIRKVTSEPRPGEGGVGL